MSPPSEPRAPASPSEDPTGARESSTRREEAIDALPVLAQEAAVLGSRPVETTVSRPASALVIPAVQAAAAAAGGFVAGAAVVGLVHRHRRRAEPEKGRRGGRRPRAGGRAAARAGELVQIVGSRSLLVDVHLLGER